VCTKAEKRGDKHSTIVEQLSEKIGISRILSQLLVNRGISSAVEAEEFLHPKLSAVTDSMKFADMEYAVERVAAAIKRKENILIIGDYDVDGITSTALLLKVLRFFTENLYFYIPDRIEDGYGLNKHSLDYAIQNDMKLAVTVDCGIRDRELVNYAMNKGLDIIVTDHHIPDTELPGAVAVVNSHREENRFPFKEMAGVVVAWHFARALIKRLTGKDTFLNDYLDLVSLGIIADRVPLVKDNRILASKGIEVLYNTKNLGLEALINVSGLSGRKINSHSIGFILAPRLNAAGRIESAKLAVKLLLSSERYRAKRLADKLDELNRKRQKLVEKTLREATNIIQSKNLYRKCGLVVYKEDWHVGILGIVASKLAEKYNMPAIVLTRNKDIIKGSARSIEEIDLFDSLLKVSDELTSFGGHRGAAGVKVSMDNLSRFEERWTQTLKEILPYREKTTSKAELYLPIDDITLELAKEIELLEPYGEANPEPIFASYLPWGLEYLPINGYHKSTYNSCSILVPKNLSNVVLMGKDRQIIYTLQVDRWKGEESPTIRVEGYI